MIKTTPPCRVSDIAPLGIWACFGFRIWDLGGRFPVVLFRCARLPDASILALDLAAILLYKSGLIGGAIHDVFALVS
jgi:hypothetical protein